LLPAIEEWMVERLERVQTLDRARAWIKVRGGREGGREGGMGSRRGQGRIKEAIKSVVASTWLQRGLFNLSNTHAQALIRLQHEGMEGGKEGGEEGGGWLDPLLALTACNLEECLKDAKKLAKK